MKITLYSPRVKLSDCYALGKLYTVTVVRMLVTTRLGLDSAPSIASCFLRASIGNMVYYSKGYTLTKTRNSHTIWYRGQDNAEKFGIVLYFLSLTKGTVTIITPLSPTHHYPSPGGGAKEQDCARHGEFSHWCYTSSFILFKCAYITSCAVHYLLCVRRQHLVVNSRVTISLRSVNELSPASFKIALRSPSSLVSFQIIALPSPNSPVSLTFKISLIYYKNDKRIAIWQ